MGSVQLALHAVVDELSDEQAQQTLEFARGLQQRTAPRLLDEAQWRRELEALLARIQARSAALSSQEIEADITTAADEVKEARRARRRAH